MKIKSNASPDEIDSPFYKRNEEFCHEFENFIASKNGKVKGQYNAWSYTIFGKISKPKNWTLKYKKATFSSGNLLLSSKYQNLLVLAEWETLRAGTHNSEFLIRTKTNADFFKRIFNKSLSKFDSYDKYIIKSDNKNSELITKLKSILSPLFKSGEIYKIEHLNDKLKIELRTEKHYFDIFIKIAEL